MSSLCPASYSLLSLHDEDLGNLRFHDANSSQDEILVQRRIDINLSCKFAGDGPGNANCRLEVISWKNGSTDLCGSCSFCNHLADSMQQTVESNRWDPWNIRSKLDPDASSQTFDMRGTIQLEKLEYLRDHKQQNVNKLSMRSMSSYWDVYLLLLRGYILLHRNDMEPGKESRKIGVDLAFELFGEDDDPVVKLLKIHRRPLRGPRLSEDNIEKMRNWIKDCDENHDRCFPESKHLSHEAALEATIFFPTRMIEVGAASDNKYPRLVITSDMQTRASKYEATKYMALSYCWGPVHGMLMTTHDTLYSRLENIGFDTMPQAFQDAVTIARRLGIPYLWIDSLCIIQDDARDWQFESSKMAEIFSNSYLTVIAAVGSGCNDSFLSPDSPGLSCTIPLKLNSGLAIQGHFSLRFRRRRTSDKMADIISSKWITRGWTFQEERLARRVLIFGENKFFFDCRTLERSQDTERRRLRPDWVPSVTEGPSEDPSEALRINMERTEKNSHWGHWRTLCTHYAHRELTFPEDKLPAISGMASKIAKKVGSEYLAGLWRKNLTHDLFWQTDATATKPKNYRAPSWSWASLDGRISWPSWRSFDSCSKCTLYCTVLDAQTTCGSLDSYGAVEDGFLKVRGVIEKMKVMWVGGSRSQPHWRLYHGGEEIGNADLDMKSDHIQVNGQEYIYHALLVSECKSPYESEITIRGLLMKKNGCKRDNYDEFERVGTFAVFSGVVPGQYGSLGIWDTAEEVIMIV